MSVRCLQLVSVALEWPDNQFMELSFSLNPLKPTYRAPVLMKLSLLKLYIYTVISGKLKSIVLSFLVYQWRQLWFCVFGEVCARLFAFRVRVQALYACDRANRESWAVQGISCIITGSFSEAGWILIEFCGVFHRLWSHGSKIRENFQAWCPSASHPRSLSFFLPSSLFFLHFSSPFCTLRLFLILNSLFQSFPSSWAFVSLLIPFLCLTLSVAFSLHSVSLWNLY